MSERGEKADWSYNSKMKLVQVDRLERLRFILADLHGKESLCKQQLDILIAVLQDDYSRKDSLHKNRSFLGDDQTRIEKELLDFYISEKDIVKLLVEHVRSGRSTLSRYYGLGVFSLNLRDKR